MPTYEYRCKDCGEQLEVVQSFSDDPLTQCPRCSGTLRKVFYTPGISFKGSGFYKTDSRSASSASVPSASKPATSSADAPSTPMGDAQSKGTSQSKPSSGSNPSGGAPAKSD